ncbi:MAG: deoxyuridine 5'-triphosphate nucleotidohydrolase [Oscillospiraceae bacterium]|nr:deoxyuridine 5'-triphosphate nucleotidohydrolase [Oscillospiraceae bacterium]
MTPNRIAIFETVSYHQFRQAAEGCNAPLQGDALLAVYDRITSPRRATEGSAGYDFFSPFSFALHPQETITIPTGIRVQIQPGWWLGLLPRSGHGFKFRVQLDNTLGVIDSDYYYADNEGHILVKISNDSLTGKQFHISEGDGFVQGIFLPYGITTDDEAEARRTGGFGSTDRGGG